ncbi:MAG: LacI family DNA-binding transcriptional regulator [Spirochaetota bacterium]
MASRREKHPYMLVKDRIKDMARRGIVAPGQAVPSVRHMMRVTGLSAVTVQRAYTELKQEGVLFSRHGAGYFIADKKKRSSIVEIFLPSEHLTLYLLFLQGAHAAAAKAGLTLRLHDLDTDKLAWGRETMRLLSDAKREGSSVIFIQEAFNDVRERCRDTAISSPFVTVEWMLPGAAAVVNDYERSAAMGLEYLVKKRSAKRILVLTGRENQYNAQLKLKGIREAAERLSIADIDYRATDFDAYSAYHEAKRYLKNARPHAVFCANDYEAIGVCGALTEAGLLPGKGVAVLGYGNFIDKATSHFPITTIDQRWRDMGEKAVDMIAAKVRGEAFVPVMEIPARFVNGAT